VSVSAVFSLYPSTNLVRLARSVDAKLYFCRELQPSTEGMRTRKQAKQELKKKRDKVAELFI